MKLDSFKFSTLSKLSGIQYKVNLINSKQHDFLPLAIFHIIEIILENCSIFSSFTTFKDTEFDSFNFVSEVNREVGLFNKLCGSSFSEDHYDYFMEHAPFILSDDHYIMLEEDPISHLNLICDEVNDIKNTIGDDFEKIFIEFVKRANLQTLKL